MKVFITGINWTLWANKNGSTNMNDFFYQLTHKDGRTSEMFKITGAMDILNMFKLTKKKFDVFCEAKFETVK